MTDFTTIKKLFGISEPIGFDDETIQFAISNIGMLPQVLIDYYTELGKHEGLNHSYDYLVHPEQLHERQCDDFLVFWFENQDVTVWGIRSEDLCLANPPVYANCDDNGWKKEKDALTDFFAAAANFQAMFGLPYCSSFLSITHEKATIIRGKYQRKEAQLPEWFGIEFFGNEEDSVISLTRNGDHIMLLYASNSELHVSKMDSELTLP